MGKEHAQTIKDAKRFFPLNDNLTFLNNGSFGVTPNILLEEAYQERLRIEQNPIVGVYYEAQPKIRQAAELLRPFLGGNPTDLIAFTPNATTGIQTTVNSLLKYNNKDTTIFYTDYAYPAVKNIIVTAQKQYHINLHYIDFPTLTFNQKQLTAHILRAVDGNSSDNKIVIVDQIISPTGMKLANKELVEKLKNRNVLVVVDGAHSPGSMVCPAYVGADVWTGNLHKWAFGLRPTANIIIDHKWEEVIRPPIVSNHQGQGFVKEFDYQGTNDPTNWLLAPKSIQFGETFGGWDNIREHQKTLISYAYDKLHSSWNVQPIAPRGLFLNMLAVSLPQKLQFGATETNVDILRNILREEHNIEIAITLHHNSIMARLSAGIYNTVEDIDKLDDIVKFLSQKMR